MGLRKANVSQRVNGAMPLALFTPLSCFKISGLIKMIRCAICGAPIKPWFETCYQCYNPPLKTAIIPEPIVAKEFMQKMGIDEWK